MNPLIQATCMYLKEACRLAIMFNHH